jgi:hypothetical protein
MPTPTPPTPQEFIEKWPLYTRADIKNFDPPKSITRMCGPCGKETTWVLSGANGTAVDTSPQLPFQFVGYTCVLCTRNALLVLYRKLDWREDKDSYTTPKHKAYFSVQKIGQTPPQSIEIPADLKERLGTTANYYRNALVCRAQNYGIGAVAYMRRIVEEKTDELIDVVVELAQTFGEVEKTIESLRKAKEQIRYEDKLKVASELIPAALRPGGVNPVGQLYIHLSIGLHGKTDDECIAVFDDLKADFEYVFRNLHLQATERREFAQRVQERAGRATTIK